jgi:hypothetical protein
MQPLTMNDFEQTTIEQIKSQPAWALRARLIHNAKTTRQWKKRGEHTFTRFLQRCAQAIGVHETLLWREQGAYIYLTETLAPKLAAADLLIEEVGEISQKVSAEHFAILERIERVAPEADFLKLASQVIAAEVTRTTLRVYWESLKPAMEGRTARGRNKASPYAKSRVVEEMITATLTTAHPDWTGVTKPFAFEAFVGDDALQLDFPGQPPYRPDAVIVVQEDRSSRPIFHAVSVRESLQKGQTPDFLAAVECFDAFWLAVPVVRDLKHNSAAYNLPNTVGLLLVFDDQVRVVRAPAWEVTHERIVASVETPRHIGTRTGDVAIALLSKRLKRY